MFSIRTLVLLFILLAAGAAFAQTPPDLSGYWDVQVDVGTRVTAAEMTLGKSGNAWLGTFTPKGTNTLAVSSLKLDDGAVDMVVETPEGVVTFQGTLGEDGLSMSGTVTYHKGQTFPMTARKRPRGN